MVEIKRGDKQVLAYQLGREPRNLVKVVKRCQQGYTQVVLNHPILANKEQPGLLPTIFWLSCPELNYMLDRLEEDKAVQRAEKIITKDQDLTEQLKKAHQDYATIRLDLLDEEMKKEFKHNYPGRYNVLKDSGVGGILDNSGIKCLHTHYAHYLAGGDNPVGKLADKWLKQRFGQDRLNDCNKCEVAKDESSSS